jgi:hypothetical protein
MGSFDGPFFSQMKWNMEMSDEEEIEKQAVDEYFEDIHETLPLYNVLYDYVTTTPISKIKHKNAQDLFFAQTENGVFYRGHIRAMYLDYTWFKNLGKCLYITHVIISPRRGQFLHRSLRQLFNELPMDSVYIESILSQKVLDSFVSKGWTQDNNNNSVILFRNDVN